MPPHPHALRGALVLFCALAALAACSGRQASAVAPDALPLRDVTPVVVALGDSLTSGPGLSPAATVPARLERRIREAGYPHRLVNAGVHGDTSAGGARRLESALVPNARVLIVALGANDGLRGLPVPAVRENLAQIIRRAQASGLSVLLCGMEAPPIHGWRYTLDFHQIFPALAAEFDVPLMPFLLAGVIGNPDLNQPDLVHPNEDGAAVIAERIWPYLEPLLASTAS